MVTGRRSGADLTLVSEDVCVEPLHLSRRIAPTAILWSILPFESQSLFQIRPSLLCFRISRHWCVVGAKLPVCISFLHPTPQEVVDA